MINVICHSKNVVKFDLKEDKGGVFPLRTRCYFR